MHDGAGAIVEDGMVLVLTVLGEAVVAAFLAALKIFGAKIPAAWPLRQISANACHVADLRRGSSTGRFRKGQIFFLNPRMLFDLRQRDQRPHAETLRALGDIAQSLDVADV